MAVVKRNQNLPFLQIFRFLPVLAMVILLAGCAATPYESKFSCPPTYGGVCEPPIDAYKDSLSGVDPSQFDPEWQKRRKEWEEKHKDLLEARKKAWNETSNSSSDSSSAAPGYREKLFEELKDVISAPETPILLPPKVVRVLVLGSPDGDMYVAPHYVFFMLDKPRWVLRKIPEKFSRVSQPFETTGQKAPSGKKTKRVADSKKEKDQRDADGRKK